MRVLILGGTGQLGRLLAAHLQAAGHQLIVTGRTLPPDLPSALVFHPFDALVDQVDRLPRADVCINCIGLLDHRSAAVYEQLHVTLVRALAESCDAYLIHLSALGARPDHPVRFLNARGRGEHWLARRERQLAVLRPSVVLTPGTPLLRNLALLARLGQRLGGYPMPDGGRVLIQPVAAFDLAEAVVRLVARQPSYVRLDVVGPTRYRLAQLAEFVCRARGLRARPLPFPKVLALPAAWLGAVLGGRFLSPEHLRLLDWDNVAAPEPLAALLGRAPQVVEAQLLDPAWYR